MAHLVIRPGSACWIGLTSIAFSTREYENGGHQGPTFSFVGRWVVGVDADQLLTKSSRGDEGAAARLTPLLYDELRRLADRYLGQGRPSVQPTSLVHEAYMRLVDRTRVDFDGRTHFLAASPVAMRCVLVDRARARRAAKREGEWMARAPGDRGLGRPPQSLLDGKMSKEILTVTPGRGMSGKPNAEPAWQVSNTSDKEVVYVHTNQTKRR